MYIKGIVDGDSPFIPVVTQTRFQGLDSSLCTYPGCSADHLSRVLVRRLQTLRFILHCLSFGFKVLDFSLLKHVLFLISYHIIVSCETLNLWWKASSLK
ncbi:hypothetical protein CBS76997_4436 [Aspergillus niger]|nr:hypothetical protein CBS13152_9631 [Aspergillus niger]KAI3045952.1 hypothetical protein CBS76997_4436 [Aspergillus niger]